MRLNHGKLSLYADLSKYAMGLNDMVTDRYGNAYVGAYGFDITSYHGQDAKGWIIHVHPDGKITKEGEEARLTGPNGMAITADGRHLIAADTIRSQLVQFDLDEYGCLHNPCIYANTESGPDGISLSGDTIWAAFPHQRTAAEIGKNGEIMQKVQIKNTPLCCAAGITDSC